jgi:hypothetical protein
MARWKTPAGEVGSAMPLELMNRVGTFVTAACLAASFSIPAAAAEPDSVEMHLLPVQGSVYMLNAGTAGNSAVQIGKDGVLVVNALRAGLAPQFDSLERSTRGRGQGSFVLLSGRWPFFRAGGQ